MSVATDRLFHFLMNSVYLTFWTMLL